MNQKYVKPYWAYADRYKLEWMPCWSLNILPSDHITQTNCKQIYFLFLKGQTLHTCSCLKGALDGQGLNLVAEVWPDLLGLTVSIATVDSGRIEHLVWMSGWWNCWSVNYLTVIQCFFLCQLQRLNQTPWTISFFLEFMWFVFSLKMSSPVTEQICCWL